MEAAWAGSWALCKGLTAKNVKKLPARCHGILDNITARHREAKSLDYLLTAWKFLETDFGEAGKEITDIDKLELIKNKGQRFFYSAKLEIMQAASLSSGSLADRVRKLSCSGKYAGAWLNAIPKYYAFKLTPEQMQTALRLRLGLVHPCIFTSVRCAGCEKRTVDAQGIHCLTCTAGGNELWVRHQQVLQCFHEATRTTGKFSRIEELHTVLPDKKLANGRTTEQIPDQLVERFTPEGRDVVTDVSVTHPVAVTYIRKAATALGAAKEREKEKVAHGYADAAESVGKIFIPLAIETFGAWGPAAQDFFKQLKRIMDNKLPKVQDTTWTTASWASCHSQKVSIALQRGNAEAILIRGRRNFRATHVQDGVLPADHQSGDAD